MMAKRQKQERISTERGSSALEISLGSLLGRGETCGERRPEHSQGKEHREALSAAPSPRAQQAILSRESKGRGGKTVTAVSFRGSPPSDLNALAKELRTSLGCGGTVEGERILLQGDQTARAEAWLAARGTRVTRGN